MVFLRIFTVFYHCLLDLELKLLEIPLRLRLRLKILNSIHRKLGCKKQFDKTDSRNIPDQFLHMQSCYVFRLHNWPPRSGLRWLILSSFTNETLIKRSLLYQALSPCTPLRYLIFNCRPWLPTWRPLNGFDLLVRLCLCIEIWLRHIFARSLWIILLFKATRAYW